LIFSQHFYRYDITTQHTLIIKLFCEKARLSKRTVTRFVPYVVLEHVDNCDRLLSELRSVCCEAGRVYRLWNGRISVPAIPRGLPKGDSPWEPSSYGATWLTWEILAVTLLYC